MGPSGCGKSTLLNVIGALIPASGGKVKVNGKALERMGHRQLTDIRRADVGWIFQDFNLIVNLNALENVMIPMHLAGKSGPGVEKRAKDLLKMVGLTNRMDHFPDTLSGGQQQRVAIARALVNDPPLIVADEPTGNLDSHTGIEIIELFKELAAQGKGILMVTHDAILANSSQKTYLLRGGVLHKSLDKEEI
jgi:putative ABC transport system ATP-binding protein